MPELGAIPDLPKWALIAFGARCAQRAKIALESKLGQSEHTDLLESALSKIEEAARTGSPPLGVEADINELRSLIGYNWRQHINYDAHANQDLLYAAASGLKDYESHESKMASECAGAARAFEVIESSLRAILDDTDVRGKIANCADCILGVSFDLATGYSREQLKAELKSDLTLLEYLANSERWDRQATVDSSIFALHSSFGANSENRSAYVEVVTHLERALVDTILRDPGMLYSLSPRGFEEFVAGLLDGFGYEVHLTARTRDGGKDITAIERRLSPVMFMVECKKYARNQKVGISYVQRLHGVVTSEGASKGILVTTASDFTRPAKGVLSKHAWTLEGRAFDGLLDWLRSYQNLLLRRGVC